ncbi:hypothetical protein B5M44_04435 [Shinella sumterensis]|uniref:hypothetical protein n=1 Tax=Shinella sumterensis TaxID=1967501 RepID=UPI00106DEF36|nr:hypothetical protein [Shinella sumterensis]MCD1264009.1 hypothetical protein [Shinella sumterensis]TFE99451.1 hypothetical protein B5M44_04435 [Shinella sumterensis]
MKLNSLEEEFIAEMAAEPGSDNEWAHFDPPFVRKAYDRFVRNGWLEYRGDGHDRGFRWTPAGRNALDKERG